MERFAYSDFLFLKIDMTYKIYMEKTVLLKYLKF